MQITTKPDRLGELTDIQASVSYGVECTEAIPRDWGGARQNLPWGPSNDRLISTVIILPRIPEAQPFGAGGGVRAQWSGPQAVAGLTRS